MSRKKQREEISPSPARISQTEGVQTERKEHALALLLLASLRHGRRLAPHQHRIFAPVE